MKKLKKIVWTALNVLGVGGSVQLYLKSAPKQYGWFRSFHTKRSVDAQGEPLPWYTYPFIAFLASRLRPDMRVFEYGAGNSTRWYAARVANITAVEHEAAWVKILAPQLPANAALLTRALDDTYVQAVAHEQKTYQIVVVDGRQRVACACFAARYLTPDGVLILDNSERPAYQSARDFLTAEGFRSLDFYGMTPIVSDESCTSVFYRPGNCLGI